MLNAKRYWQVTVDQHFRDIIYHIISPCKSMVKNVYMHTRYLTSSPLILYQYATYVKSIVDACVVSEYDVTNGRLVSLGTRHKWRGLTLASDDYINGKNGCDIYIMFQYEKSEPFSGFPPYQAAALVDIIKAPNKWRMCRLGRCYMLRDDSQFPKVSTWDEAERFCQSHNGHLLSINSDTEQSVILDWLLRRPFTRKKQKPAIAGYMSMYLRASIIFLGLKASHQVGMLKVFDASIFCNRSIKIRSYTSILKTSTYLCLVS